MLHLKKFAEMVFNHLGIHVMSHKVVDNDAIK